MMIQELCALANRDSDLPPPMYQKQPIRYVIGLRADGTMVGRIRDLSSPQDKALKRGLPLMAPHVKRTVGIRPKLLADTAPYVLGFAGDDAKGGRAEQQHAQFVELVDQCRDATGEPSVAAVSAFLAQLDREALPLPDDFDPSATITFEIGPERERPIDLQSVRQFWAMYNSTGGTEGGGALLPCIGCGQLRPILERHPIKIKGVPGGQILKDLVSANATAFESYGLKASQIAPMCQECAEAYANALNALLADKRTSLWMKEGAYAFWTRSGVDFAPASLFLNPDEQQVMVRSLMEAYRTGFVAALDLDPTPFFAVGLSASGARLVVRDWLETSVGDAKERLGRYFALQEMVEWDGAEGAAAPLFRLTGATVRNPRKEKPAPIVARALIRLALVGTPLPMDLLYLAVRRNRAEQNVSRERAMLIKMVLCSHLSKEEESTMSELEATKTESAYLCGRLLAVLNDIQYQAFRPSVPNTTIVDRYYGSASSTPGVVFGLLVRNAQPHLAKLRKKGQSGQATAAALDRRLQDLAIGIQDLPTTLTLQEQGLFALGFYHQRADDRRAAREYAEARKGSSGSDETAS